MNIFSKQPAPVLEHETALQVYFDALFQDMPGAPYAEEPQKTLAGKLALETNNTLGPAIEIAEDNMLLAVDICRSPNKALAGETTPFPSLLFSAHGVKMVVPLIQLHSIVNVTAPHNMCRVSDAAWFMGLLPWRGKHVKVIDICKLMAMEGAEFKGLEESAPKRLVLINDGSWGFVCDDVSEVFTLCPGQVKWRADRTHHAWLAGTVLEHMCALLDVDGFAPLVLQPVPAA